MLFDGLSEDSALKKKQIGDVKDITIEIIQNETVKKKPKNNYEKTEPQGFARQSDCLTRN